LGKPLKVEPDQFVEGQTRVETVIHELGPPNRASRTVDGVAFLYEHWVMREFQLGIAVPLPVFEWFKFLKARNYLDQDILLLTFDNQGVLRSAGASKWQEGLGGGTGVQFIFSMMSFSDVSKFLRPADAHNWGQTMLQPLPVALNSAQSLRTGEHGLQQPITPDYAGQHTLEMPKTKTEKEKKKIKKDYQWQPGFFR